MRISCIILFFLIPSKIFASQVCDSISQVEIPENSSPGYLIIDLKQALSNSAVSVNNLYLSDDLDYFQLTRGRITLQKSIDREKYCSNSNKHQVIVNNRCCNGDCCAFIGIYSKDPSKNKFYVRVKITDINDNAPKFSESIYFQELLENTKLNTKIPLPLAIDQDELFNSISKYEIENSNDTFQRYFKLYVEEVSLEDNAIPIKQPALIIKEPIDRELIGQIEFNLIAKDGGIPVKEGKTRIIFKILDENDNEPQFSKSLYKITVKENEIISADLVNINVEDKDSDSNGRVTISFAPSTSQEIQSILQITTTRNSATLRLISKLDYEITNHYKFDILAKDHGQPPRSSVATIDITVLNVNDERPDIIFYHLGRALSKPFSRIYIDEGNEKDDIICLIKVSDLDSASDLLSCQLETSTEFFYISLIKTNRLLDNKQTYEIRTKVSFDREFKNIYEINVICSDSDNNNELSQTGKLQVHIKDKNDNAPQFTKTHYYGTVKENRADEFIDLKKDKILAIDKDEAENGTVEYFIKEVSDNLKNHFGLNKDSATVKVIITLDYETIKKVTMTIGASDKGSPSLTSYAKLIINIEDTNDNQLELETSFYPFEVYENEPIGTFVGRINVTDKDTELNNKRVIMKIKNSPSDGGSSINEKVDQIFSIDSDTGKIYTKMKLDREKNNQITFTILAYNPNPLDFGFGRIDSINQYRETVEIPVSVTILNKNDNSPMMVLRDKQTIRAVNAEVTFYRQHISENPMQDNCISFPYVFIDLDDLDSSKIKTTLKKNKYFNLNMEHGVICIENKIPPKGSYMVTIIADDSNNNDTSIQEFNVKIFVKDDLNANNDKQQPGIKYIEPKINEQLIRPNNKNFRNNLLYAIIGSIAAALFLLIIVILVGFKKFTNGDTNYETKVNNPENVQDYIECQNFFEYIPESKYNDLSFVPNKNYPQQSLKYKSELDFRNINTKIIPKYSSADPMFQEIQFTNYPTGKMNISENYQAIPSQISSDRNNLYFTLSKPSQSIQQHKELCIDTNVLNVSMPVFVTSQSSDKSTKTKKSNIKALFKSTFV